MKKKNTTDFIREATLVHGNKYNYSISKYEKNNIKVKIICPEHGVFEQTPSKHLSAKHGCPKCANIKTHDEQKKCKKTFIKEAIKVHGDKYDYSLVEYINNRSKVKIICPIHGEFEQIVSNHLRGRGCKYCGGTSKMDKLKFINKANLTHNFKYDYSLVNYVNSQTPIKIICPTHGEFEQLPNNHLSKKQGCYECLDKVFDTNTFIEKANIIHEYSYDYSISEYEKSNIPINIICKQHGVFKQNPNSHLSGQGCPKCSFINSKQEKDLVSFLKNLNLNIIENSRENIKPLELDIFIPSHNLAIEFNGLYWHSEEFLSVNYHLNKTQICESKGIQLIHIFEDEWVFKRNIVESKLKNILGLTKNKIFARKCIIKEVSSKSSKEFLETNHLQGKVNSSVKLGLFYNDELVSLMTFGKGRIALGGDSNEFEMLRFCNKLNTNVIGGADKLLKYFIKNYNPKTIISYADRRWSQGNLYEKLNFNFIHDSKPNYWYVNNNKRMYRFGFRKDVLVKQGFDKNKSEHEIMLDRGIYRIYDCGNKKYVLNIDNDKI